MKRILMLLLVALVLLTVSACKDNGGADNSGVDNSGSEINGGTSGGDDNGSKGEEVKDSDIEIAAEGKTAFSIVLATKYKGTMVEDAVNELCKRLAEACGCEISVVSEKDAQPENEILIGLAPRLSCINATAGLEARDYRIKVESGKILLTGGSLYSICLAVDALLEHAVLDSGRLSIGEKYDYVYRYSQMNTEEVYGTLDERRAQYANPLGRPMVAAHRSEHSHSTENSLAGIISAIALGVDIIEIDLQRTKDGYYILCHDDTLTSSTNVALLAGKDGLPTSHKVCDWTLKEIKKLTLKNSALGEEPVLFDDVLSVAKGRVILVLDKIKTDEDALAVYDIAVRMRAVDSLAYQFTSFAAHERAYADSGIPVMYMHWKNDIEACASFVSGGGYKDREYALQAIQTTVNDETVDKALTDIVRTKCRIYANTLWSTGLSSDNANTWNTLYEGGVTIIQTDKPFEVVALARYITFGVDYSIEYDKSPVLSGACASLTLGENSSSEYRYAIGEGESVEYTEPITITESSFVTLTYDGEDGAKSSFTIFVMAFCPEYYALIGASVS